MFSLTLISTAFSVVSEVMSRACEESEFRDMEQGLVWKTVADRNPNSIYRKKTEARNLESSKEGDCTDKQNMDWILLMPGNEAYV